MEYIHIGVKNLRQGVGNLGLPDFRIAEQEQEQKREAPFYRLFRKMKIRVKKP